MTSKKWSQLGDQITLKIAVKDWNICGLSTEHAVCNIEWSL